MLWERPPLAPSTAPSWCDAPWHEPPASAPAAVQVERVLMRSSLPRTASNKVMRRVLRDELLRGQSKL